MMPLSYVVRLVDSEGDTVSLSDLHPYNTAINLAATWRKQYPKNRIWIETVIGGEM